MVAMWTDLKDYVGAANGKDGQVEKAYDQAVLLVNRFVGDADVPAEVLERCYLEAGSELFHRQSAPNGIAQFSSFDGQPVRVARDPLVGVYPLLAHYVVVGL